MTGTTGLCEYCDKENIQFLSDEIYHHISYGKKEATALQYSKSALIINCECHDMPSCIRTLWMPRLAIVWTRQTDTLPFVFHLLADTRRLTDCGAFSDSSCVSQLSASSTA